MAVPRTSRATAADLARERGDLAAALIVRRRELGLSQVELGALAGVSYRVVHNLEAGRTEVSLERTLAVVDTLGLHLALGRGASPRVVVAEALAAREERRD